MNALLKGDFKMPLSVLRAAGGLLAHMGTSANQVTEGRAPGCFNIVFDCHEAIGVQWRQELKTELAEETATAAILTDPA
jgi:hypothetical protein